MDVDDVAASEAHRHVESGATQRVRVLVQLQRLALFLGAGHRRAIAVLLAVLCLEIELLPLLDGTVLSSHHLDVQDGSRLRLLVVGVRVDPLLVRRAGGRPLQLHRNDLLDLCLPLDPDLLFPFLVEQEVGRLPFDFHRPRHLQGPVDLAFLVGHPQDVHDLRGLLLARLLDAGLRPLEGLVLLVLGDHLELPRPDVDLLGQVGELLAVYLDVVAELADQPRLVGPLRFFPLTLGVAGGRR